ncbi:hypothetical protein CBR_g41639 [Chara braunii]|uniref:Uncharacterized protein n=1 Tax=Chara braunii TaxID=69332 RepID=A0A388LW71_CHABU|nr:hypothetical protein CBR_g41639 [Chara braunii]|eukprot:GBG86577.1 hypothetical protein CBR_g41639 [Chara braunii]
MPLGEQRWKALSKVGESSDEHSEKRGHKRGGGLPALRALVCALRKRPRLERRNYGVEEDEDVAGSDT